MNHPFGRPPLTFDAVEFVDPRAPANAPASYIAYVHQAPGQPAVGVVFRVLQTNRVFVDAAVKMSMQSYAQKDDAFKARGMYSKPMAAW